MMNKRFKLLRNQKGLTLVELLAVIVILGVIAAIAVPAIGGVISNSKTNADVQSKELLKDTAVRYLYDVDPDGDGKDSAGTAITGLNVSAGTLTVSALVSSNYLKTAPAKQTSTGNFATITVTYSSGSGWKATDAS